MAAGRQGLLWWVAVVALVVVAGPAPFSTLGMAAAQRVGKTNAGANVDSIGEAEPKPETPVCSEESKGILGKGGLHCEVSPSARE